MRRRLVVSGGTGYIGSRLVARLLDDGCAVMVVGRRDRDRDELPEGVDYVGATMDADERVARLVEFGPDAVVHLAARGGADTEPSEIHDVVETNLALGVELFEVAARSSVNGGVRFVGAGTFWQRSLVDGRPRPNSLYAATKDALEVIANYYALQRAVPSVFLRFADVYGPGDQRGRLMSALADATRSGSPIDLSAGEQVVSFVHVDDVVEALSVALRCGTPKVALPSCYSVRGPETLSLRATLELIEERLGVTIPVRFGARPYRSNEVMLPAFDDVLPGWEPTIGVADGFSQLLEVTS